MKRRPLFLQIFPVYFLIIGLSLALVLFFSVRSFRDFHLRQTARTMGAYVDLVSDKVLTLLEKKDWSHLKKYAQVWGETTKAEVSVIALDGQVLVDSRSALKDIDNQADRPEFVTALSQGFGTARRHNRTAGGDFFYAAKLVSNEKQPVAVVRFSVPLLTLEQTFSKTSDAVIVVVGIVLVLAGLASWYMARRISWPLTKLKRAAEEYAGGDLAHRMAIPKTDEIASLAESMNSMAENLETQIAALTLERNQRDAIFYSMVEGVLALDVDENILSFNPATLAFFGVDAEDVYGKTLPEVFREPDLIDFVAKLLRTRQPAETEILVERDDQKKYLRAHGNLLKDADGRHFGVLLVFQDFTRLRELEGMRKNFVANVSHELRTPLTAIKGFVETLAAGAIDDPAQAREFLKIIADQADRLNETIQDLMRLSQIEKEADFGQIEFAPKDVGESVYAAIEICQRAATDKRIRLSCAAKSPCFDKINPRLFEQAVINLIDNAVRHSPTESEVKIFVEKTAGEIRVAVQDFGPGIDKKHWQRIFERFYRVDESRGRQAGGSGLGLAIVKHIVQAHQGRIELHSELGEGTVFALYFREIP